MAQTGRKKLPYEEVKVAFPVKRKTADKLRRARMIGKGVDEALEKVAKQLLQNEYGQD